MYNDYDININKLCKFLKVKNRVTLKKYCWISNFLESSFVTAWNFISDSNGKYLMDYSILKNTNIEG
ncbi:hypothetical protein HHI36_021058 [Cryptolaemus montrouzieri]|uniref:Uncharacterized protein n=1 Tax=Cryptolaemus montrouzieri TaxID=559131 RepID=A0ABD2MVS6_9CUCU